MTTFYYTDGACKANGLGGWSCIVVQEGIEIKRLTGRHPKTTNNRMELLGCINALTYAMKNGLSDNVIITDSRYCIHMLQDRERTRAVTQVNHDLISQGRSLIQALWSCRFEWVKGHAGAKYGDSGPLTNEKWNDLADRLATRARDGKLLA